MVKPGEGFQRELEDLVIALKAHLVRGMGVIIMHYCQYSHLFICKEIPISKILLTSRKNIQRDAMIKN